MAITFAKNHWVLPTNWRETFGSHVTVLGVPELGVAFTMAEAILLNLNDAQVESIVQFLVQSATAAKGNTKNDGPDPRAIYEIYSTTGHQSPEVPIMDALAVGTLLALERAYFIVDKVNITHQWVEVEKALVTARAFSEWLYIVKLLKSNMNALEHLFPRQLRAATKKKITQKKSMAAKKGAHTMYAEDKKLIFKYYETNKLDSMSADEAASKIESANLTNVKHSTIKTYIYAYRKEKGNIQ